MDTPPPSKPSWPDLLRQARSETVPNLDVRAALRQQLRSEAMTESLAAPPSGLLDEVLALACGLRGLSTFAALTLSGIGFGWIIFDAVGEINLVLQLQNHLLAGL